MKINKGTAFRTFFVACAILTLTLESTGVDIAQYVDNPYILFVTKWAIALIVAIGTWFNNSYSFKAKLADEVKEALRTGKVNVNLVEDLLKGEDLNE